MRHHLRRALRSTRPSPVPRRTRRIWVATLLVLEAGCLKTSWPGGAGGPGQGVPVKGDPSGPVSTFPSATPTPAPWHETGAPGPGIHAVTITDVLEPTSSASRNLHGSFVHEGGDTTPQPGARPTNAPTLESYLRKRFGATASIRFPAVQQLACQVQGVQREVYPGDSYVWESLRLHFTLIGTVQRGALSLQVHAEGHYARGMRQPQAEAGYDTEIPLADLERYANRLLADIREGLK
jgi:hypothetical protein